MVPSATYTWNFRYGTCWDTATCATNTGPTYYNYDYSISWEPELPAEPVLPEKFRPQHFVLPYKAASPRAWAPVVAHACGRR